MKLIIEIEMNEEVDEIHNKDLIEIKTDGSLISSPVNAFSTEIKDVPDSIIRAACRRLSIGDSEDDGKRKRRKEDQLALIPKGAGKNSTVAKAGLPDENQSGEDVNHTVAEHIGPKVPPLKIVIPQQVDTEQGGVSRGKQNVSARHSNLPYVVVSHASSYSGGYSALTSTRASGSASTTGSVVNSLAVTSTDCQRSQHRVLRSNQRSNSINNVGDNSPLSNADFSPHRAMVSPSKSCLTQSAGSLSEKSTLIDSSYSGNGNGTASVTFSPNGSAGEVPPRKRRLKTSREVIEQSDAPSLSLIEQAFLDGSMANCYQMFVNIRKQIEMKRRSLFPVQPKPPQGFKDYLMNKCTYLLDDDAKAQMNSKVINVPPECPFYMSNLYGEQEMERLKLKMQHLVEKEKLVLSVEQEILRVHGRAARALANQALPFSVCTLLKDEDVYRLLPTTQQQEKERNARSRYNGRIFISWLQDVDDKWEKIKEEMLLRHRNEAIGLQARQKLVWSLQMCSYGSYNSQVIGQVNDTFVPMVLKYFLQPGNG